MAPRYFDLNGRPITLSRKLRGGGEGEVFDIEGDSSSVAKLYFTQPTPEKAQKLECMTRAGTKELKEHAAWPTTVLRQHAGGPIVGFVMPKIVGFKEIHLLYGPQSRRREFPGKGWSFLVHVAMNCAAAFESVHTAGHVIGDVNPGNLLVSTAAMVRLIDCDSFQIHSNGTVFPCTVGVEEYTPPEIQGKRFASVVRTQEHDLFGLAVLIFHLLFIGRHPFCGRFLGAGDMPIRRAIQERRFAFGQGASLRQMAAPPFSVPLAAVPAEVVALFEQAFGGVVNTPRPVAKKWLVALQTLGRQLIACQIDSAHTHASHLAGCPWCEIVVNGGPTFFVGIHSGPIEFLCADSDLASLWAEADSISVPPWSLPSPTPTQRSLKRGELPAEAVRANALRRRLGHLASSSFWGALGALMLFLSIGAPMAIMASAAFSVIGGALLAAAYRAKSRSDSARGLKQKRRAVDDEREELQGIEDEWGRLSRESRRANDQARAALATLRQSYSALKADYDREVASMAREKQRIQREDYLRNVLIDAHDIEKIKAGRKATLQSYGIESAFDVLYGNLDAVPGFGNVLREALRSWAQLMDARFKFDPSKAIPETERRALVSRFRAKQIQIKGQIERKVVELRDAAANATRNHQSAGQRLLAAREALAAAQEQLRMTEAE